jgi:DNA-binding protein H-NS
MNSYNAIQKQIAELQKQAEAARIQEIDGALSQIKALMQEYGIGIQDLASKQKKKSVKKGAVGVQFQDGKGNTWSGRGRMPSWLKGQDKEQFRTN